MPKLPEHQSNLLQKKKSPLVLEFPEREVALMKLDDFQDLEKFKVFADSSFKILKERAITHLIIDLRNNYGGDSDVGDCLLQYLLDVPFRQYNRVFAKHSRLLKDRLLAHKQGKPLSHSDSVLLLQPNGKVDTLKNEDETLLELPHRFRGKVSLLVSTATFSSAADFAQAFSFYRRGNVIGEETGGWIISFGDIVQTTLPATKLPLIVE